MRIAHLGSDPDGGPGPLVYPAPAGEPGLWMALDHEAQQALMFLIQCAQMAVSVRDPRVRLPLAYHSAQDGLRMALERNAVLFMALDPTKDPVTLTDQDLGAPPEEPALWTAEELDALTPQQRARIMRAIERMGDPEDLPPGYR